jgi:hypothetical protein
MVVELADEVWGSTAASTGHSGKAVAKASIVSDAR